MERRPPHLVNPLPWPKALGRPLPVPATIRPRPLLTRLASTHPAKDGSAPLPFPGSRGIALLNLYIYALLPDIVTMIL